MARRVIKKTNSGFTLLGNFTGEDFIKTVLCLVVAWLVANMMGLNGPLFVLCVVLIGCLLIFLFVLKTYNPFYINFIVLLKVCLNYINEYTKRSIKLKKEKKAIKTGEEVEQEDVKIPIFECKYEFVKEFDNLVKIDAANQKKYYAFYQLQESSIRNKNNENAIKVIYNFYQLFNLEENIDIKILRIPVTNDDIDTDIFKNDGRYKGFIDENIEYLNQLQNSYTLKTFVIIISDDFSAMSKSMHILKNFEYYIPCSNVITNILIDNYLIRLNEAQVHDTYLYDDVNNEYYTNLTVTDVLSEVEDNWLLSISDYTDYCCMMDFSMINKAKVKKDINTSYNEKMSLVVDDKRSQIDKQSDLEEAKELLTLGNEVNKNLERIFKVSIKNWYQANSLEMLNEKIYNDQINFRNDDVSVRLNNYMLDKEVTYMLFPENRLNHQFDVESQTITYGLPNDVEIINDQKGVGFSTLYNGYLIFNQFFNNSLRKSYSMTVVGEKGFGKTTLVKKIAKDNLLTGNKVVILDLENENGKFVKALHGRNISVSKDSDFSINIMQIYKVSDESDNVTANIDRLIGFFAYFYKFERVQDQMLRAMLQSFYNHYGISDEAIKNDGVKEYPILSDFINYCDQLKKGNFKKITDEDNADIYINFYKEFKISVEYLLSDNTSKYFNSRNNNTDFSNDMLINVELKDILNLAKDSAIGKAYLDTIIYVFIVLEMNANREYNFKNGIERANIKEKMSEARFLHIIIDEVHNLYNSSSTEYLEILSKLRKQDAKYLTAITDVLQNASSYTNTNNTQRERALNEIWANSTYHIFFKQKLINKDTVENLFGENNNITEEGISKIIDFKEGDFMLEFNNNIYFTRLELQPKEIELYRNVS